MTEKHDRRPPPLLFFIALVTIVAILVGLVAGAALTYIALRSQLRERAGLRGDLERARVTAVEAEKAAVAAQARLETLEEKLPETMESISAKALAASRETFLAEAGLKVGSTVAPVTEQLDLLRKLVAGLQAEHQKEGGRLDEALRSLSDTTGSLATALGSAQTRGRWGEEQLERILDLVGMKEGIDYSRQEGSEGARPDIVVHLPGNKNVVIDAKAPFDEFERAERATTADERTAALALFAKRVRDHVTALGKKDYSKRKGAGPDFVFMYLPGDAYLAAAEEHDKELFAYAYAKNVVVATPRTVLVLLRTIQIAWRNENASEDVRKILDAALELHGRLETFVPFLEKAGTSIDRAAEAYRAARASLNARVLPAVRTLEKIAGTNRVLKALPESSEDAGTPESAERPLDPPADKFDTP